MPETYAQVRMIFDDRVDADRAARDVAEQRLAASAQVWGPLITWYRWQGDVMHDDEWALVMTTTAILVPDW